MSAPPLNQQNMLHFIIMVAMEPATVAIIKESRLDAEEQRELLGICYSELSAEGRLELLLKKDWTRLGPAVEAVFYKNLTEKDFNEALEGMTTARGRQYVQRWATKIVQALADRSDLCQAIAGHYPEMDEPIRRYRHTANSHFRDRVIKMLAIRRPVVDRLLDDAVKDDRDRDPRRSMEDVKPKKISLDGEIIDIPATAEALKQALADRREFYSWGGITTEYYEKDGEPRRRVIFYDRS